jgi:multiple sugar transport system substrate-binding protein
VNGGRTYRGRAGGGVSRREFLRLGGVGLAGAALLGGGALAGCGGEEGSSGSGTQLTFNFIPDEGGGVQTLIDRFNEQHRGEIRVRWREAASASDEFFDRLRTELQSGRSEVDVIGGDVIWPAQLAANGWILDLSNRFTQEMRGGYLDGPLESVGYDGKIWGVPWFTDAGMFYYRRDLLEKSGASDPPKTWDEMKEMVERVRAETGTEIGYVFQGARDEGGVVDALEHIWNAGGDVLDGSRVIIDSPESVEALELRRTLITDGISPQASGDYTTQESQAAFTRGDAVFMRNWPFVYGLLSDRELSEVRPEQVGIGLMPAAGAGDRSYSGLGGWNFYVNANSEDKIDEIWTFIQFMSTEESQRTLALESARLPTLRGLYSDQEVLEKVPVADLGRESLENTRPRPVSPYYSDMSLKMAEQFNASLKGDLPVDRSLAELQTELQNIVDQS